MCSEASALKALNPIIHSFPPALQIKKEFQDIVLSARQDAFYQRNMYANFGDIGVAVKVRARA